MVDHGISSSKRDMGRIQAAIIKPRRRQLRQLRLLRCLSLLQKSVQRSSADSRSSLHLLSVPAHTLALRLTSARGSSRWSRTSHGVGSFWSERARIANAWMLGGWMARGEVCGMGRACSDDSVCTVCAHACSLRIWATPALTAVLAVYMHMYVDMARMFAATCNKASD